MFNLFRKPYEKETLDAWAKISDDIGKVAILAIPVMLFGNNPAIIKVINSTLLLISTYSAFIMGRTIRKHKLSIEEISK